MGEGGLNWTQIALKCFIFQSLFLLFMIDTVHSHRVCHSPINTSLALIKVIKKRLNKLNQIYRAKYNNNNKTAGVYSCYNELGLGSVECRGSM